MSITQKVSLLLFIPVAGAVIALGVFYAFLAQTANDGAMINLAGRQRMLSKQLYIYADMINKGHEMDQTAMAEIIGSFDHVLQILEKGGQVMDYVIPAVPTEVGDDLARVRMTWVDFKNAADLVAELPADDPQAQRAFEHIAANARRLTGDSNRLVPAIEAYHHTLQQRMLYFLLAVAGFDLLMLFAGVLLIRRYIAGRKQTEGELQRTASDLQRNATELERSNRELDQFAYVASHDLKAPLRAIANLSQWIEEDIGEQLEGDTREQMDLLRGRVHRMEALIDGILQYSRVGRVALDAEGVDVGELLAETVDALAPPEGLVIDIGPGMPLFETARVRLSQVFANLIGNAIKYHDRPDGRVQVSVRVNDNDYEFTVADDGPGIAPAFHEKVFQLFQTLQARDRRESTGVGLTLVKKIVEEQGGTICLESAEGEGATFRFTWPKGRNVKKRIRNDER